MRACTYPGCVAYAVGGTTECIVHRAPGAGRLCAECEGTGWWLGPPRIPCPECAGVGLADYSRHAPRAGKQRVKVDKRGLILLASD